MTDKAQNSNAAALEPQLRRKHPSLTYLRAAQLLVLAGGSKRLDFLHCTEWPRAA